MTEDEYEDWGNFICIDSDVENQILKTKLNKEKDNNFIIEYYYVNNIYFDEYEYEESDNYREIKYRNSKIIIMASCIFYIYEI